MSKPELPKGVYRRSVGGQDYFLVSLGRDETGKQRWKSCQTIEEAKTQRKLFTHAKEQQGESLWLLSADQRADAIAALDIVKGHPEATLVAAADFYVKNFLSLVRTESLSVLIDKYYDEQVGAGMRLASQRDLRCRLKALKDRFGNRLITELTAFDMKTWNADLRKEGQSDISRRHILNRGCSFFKWAVANHYCNGNPLDPVAVKRPRIHKGDVLFYTVDQAKKILELFGNHDMLSYAVLGLFCGIRPYEAEKLTKFDFHIDGNRIVIKLRAGVAKTSRRRVLELERGTVLGDCVWAWLGGNGKLDLPDRIVSSHITFRRCLAKIKPELGFSWIDDGLRHTAATMFFALTRDEIKTSALLGHTSLEMLRSYYKGLATESEARRFYALRPKS